MRSVPILCFSRPFPLTLLNVPLCAPAHRAACYLGRFLPPRLCVQGRDIPIVHRVIKVRLQNPTAGSPSRALSPCFVLSRRKKKLPSTDRVPLEGHSRGTRSPERSAPLLSAPQERVSSTMRSISASRHRSVTRHCEAAWVEVTISGEVPREHWVAKDLWWHSRCAAAGPSGCRDRQHSAPNER